MAAHPTATTAEQERMLIALLIILCVWRNPKGGRISVLGFHQSLKCTLSFLDRIRPGLVTRLNLTKDRNGFYKEFGRILEYFRKIKLFRVETVDDNPTFILYMNAGNRIHVMLKDYQIDLEDRIVIQDECARAVEWVLAHGG